MSRQVRTRHHTSFACIGLFFAPALSLLEEPKPVCSTSVSVDRADLSYYLLNDILVHHLHHYVLLRAQGRTNIQGNAIIYKISMGLVEYNGLVGGWGGWEGGVTYLI
jgi:hypothetical protein